MSATVLVLVLVLVLEPSPAMCSAYKSCEEARKFVILERRLMARRVAEQRKPLTDAVLTSGARHILLYIDICMYMCIY